MWLPPFLLSLAMLTAIALINSMIIGDGGRNGNCDGYLVTMIITMIKCIAIAIYMIRVMGMDLVMVVEMQLTW